MKKAVTDMRYTFIIGVIRLVFKFNDGDGFIKILSVCHYIPGYLFGGSPGRVIGRASDESPDGYQKDNHRKEEDTF